MKKCAHTWLLVTLSCFSTNAQLTHPCAALAWTWSGGTSELPQSPPLPARVHHKGKAIHVHELSFANEELSGRQAVCSATSRAERAGQLLGREACNGESAGHTLVWLPKKLQGPTEAQPAQPTSAATSDAKSLSGATTSAGASQPPPPCGVRGASAPLPAPPPLPALPRLPALSKPSSGAYMGGMLCPLCPLPGLSSACGPVGLLGAAASLLAAALGGAATLLAGTDTTEAAVTSSLSSPPRASSRSCAT